MQLHCEHSSPNDDVKLDAFSPPDMTYAGNQIRGIRGEFDSCASTQVHARRALIDPFPLAAPNPLPEHIRKASVLTRGCQPGELVMFRQPQLSRPEQIVGDSKTARKKRNDRILLEIAPSSGKPITVAISQTIRHFGIEGRRRIRQVAMVLPIAGALSRPKDFRLGKRITHLSRRSQLFASAPRRFRERSAKSGAANAQQLWAKPPPGLEKGGWRPLPLGDAGGAPGRIANA